MDSGNGSGGFTLLGSVDDAVYSYAEAVSMPNVEPAWIASTRKQALQIASAYEDEDIRKKIQSAFPVLGIVAFSGVIDQPGSSIPRFPQKRRKLPRRKLNLLWKKWEQVVDTVPQPAGLIFYF